MTVTLRAWHLFAAVGVLLSALWLINRYRLTANEAQRQAEAARLEAKGIVVAEQRNTDFVVKRANDAFKENAALKAQVTAIKKASPGAKPFEVVQAQTKPIATSTSQPGCLVQAGDKLSVKVETVELATKLGNHVLAGTAACLKPDGSTLVEGPFEAQLTQVTELAPVAAPSWGAGVFGIATAHGMAYGPQVASPPLRVPLLGWQVEVIAGLGLGSLGPISTAGALLRF